MNAALRHLSALEGKLHELAQLEMSKHKLPFSMVDKSDLANLGVIRRRLVISPARIEAAVQVLPQETKELIDGLKKRLLGICECFDLNCSLERFEELILTPLLLDLGEIVNQTEGEVDVRVVHFPHLTIAPEESKGYKITNPITGYELWLTGCFDWLVLKYQDQGYNRDSLFSEIVTKDEVFKIQKGGFLLVRAKRPSKDGGTFAEVPEAVMQALVMANCSGEETVRFCLSNGRVWRFYILRKVDDHWIYYESHDWELNLDTLQEADKQLFEIVLLAKEWLSPSIPDLYVLDD